MNFKYVNKIDKNSIAGIMEMSMGWVVFFLKILGILRMIGNVKILGVLKNVEMIGEM